MLSLDAVSRERYKWKINTLDAVVLDGEEQKALATIEAVDAGISDVLH